MNILPWLLIVGVCFVMIKSLSQFISGEKNLLGISMRDKRFSAEIFYALIITYTIVILGFGLIYFILSFEGVLLVEGGELRQVSPLGSMVHSFYFSGVTMLTIGYGDITPIGIGRLLALIEALIGYILPTAFVFHIVQHKGERARD